jgi:hypothetical protein
VGERDKVGLRMRKDDGDVLSIVQWKCVWRDIGFRMENVDGFAAFVR